MKKKEKEQTVIEIQLMSVLIAYQERVKKLILRNSLEKT